MKEVVDDDEKAEEVEVENPFDLRSGLFENQETDWDCTGSLLIFHLPAESEKVLNLNYFFEQNHYLVYY